MVVSGYCSISGRLNVGQLSPLPVGHHKQVPGFYDHPGLLRLLNGWGNPFQILPS